MNALKSINQDNLRNHNISVVLSTLLNSSRPLSRAELAELTGLTKATMSLLSSILVENNVLHNRKPEQAARFGRPSTPLGFIPGAWAGMGLQINTDGYGYSVVDFTGKVLASQWVQRRMNGTNPDDVFLALDALVRPVEVELEKSDCKLVGGGLALPGLVMQGNNKLLAAHNLGWEMVDVSSYEVIKRLGIKAQNEANLAAIAQIPGYAAQRSADEEDAPRSFVYMSTDVGIGGAYVRYGDLVEGNHGFAGELGHVSVNFEGPLCRCGRHGCLETYAGRRALVEAAGIAAGEAAVEPDALEELFNRWNNHESKAVKAISRGLKAFVSVMASAINILDVDTVMLGGFWSRFDESLMEDLTERVIENVLGSSNMNIQVVQPKVADHPAVRGAALWGLRRVVENPLEFLVVKD